jgi:hypothetical protein
MKRLTAFALAPLLCLGFCLPAVAASVTVQGDYIQLGVGNNGALIDYTTFTGIKFDPTGTGNFSGPIDYLTPGTPFAFYSLGVNGTYRTAGGFDPGNNLFGTTTIDLTPAAGLPFVLTKDGTMDGLQFRQVISFDADSRSIHATLTFKNISESRIDNVVYAVGLDPDQDVTYPESEAFDTDNLIRGQGAAAAVTAIGPGNGYGITLANTSGWADTIASIYYAAPWPTDPYLLSRTFRNDGFGDNSINLGYDLGSFDIGQEKTIGYDYTLFVSPVPEPQVVAMMLCGLCLLGRKARREAQRIHAATPS